MAKQWIASMNNQYNFAGSVVHSSLNFGPRYGMKHQAVNGRNCWGHGHVPSSLTAYLSICTLTLPRPPVISGSPDVVAALIDKTTVAHNGMVHWPVSIFLPSLQNITSVSVCWDGPNQFTTRNSIPSKFRATVRSWIGDLAGSLRLNSPFIWLSVRTQFSLMISSRHCLI